MDIFKCKQKNEVKKKEKQLNFRYFLTIIELQKKMH